MELNHLNQVVSDVSAAIKRSSWLELLSYASVACSIYIILRSIYRIYFHPLRKFPGPKLNACSRFPQIVATCRGNAVEYTTALHEKYGEVVRIGPNELSFVHPDAWKDIYGYGAKNSAGSKPPKLWRFYPTVSMISNPDPHEHGRIRKMFSPAFSDRAINQQAPLFNKYVDQMVRVLGERGSNHQPVEMCSLYNFTTFDIMSDLTFSEPLHLLDNGAYSPWVQLIFDSIKKTLFLSIIRVHAPFLTTIINACIAILNPSQVEHAKHSATRVTKRLEKGINADGHDIWDLALSQEKKGKEGLTRKEMNLHAELFMTAGTETTATLMSGMTVHLFKNPQVYKKLVEEIRGAFASYEDITMEGIQALPYVNACLKEALRMYPPVPTTFPHLTPAEGSTICGRFVPPNTIVAAYHMAMYRSPRLFTDPDEFRPERWLGDKRYAKDELSAVQPFHVGPRDCLGKNVAMHEMRLMLAKILYHFELVELCPESQNWLEQKTYLFWEKPPLMVKVESVTIHE